MCKVDLAFRCSKLCLIASRTLALEVVDVGESPGSDAEGNFNDLHAKTDIAMTATPTIGTIIKIAIGVDESEGGVDTADEVDDTTEDEDPKATAIDSVDKDSK